MGSPSRWTDERSTWTDSPFKWTGDGATGRRAGSLTSETPGGRAWRPLPSGPPMAIRRRVLRRRGGSCGAFVDAGVIMDEEVNNRHANRPLLATHSWEI